MYIGPTWERSRRNIRSWQLSFTLPPLLLLILETDPLVRLEVGHPLPVDLDLVDEALPQAPPMDLLVSRILENLTKLLESLILAPMGCFSWTNLRT